MSFILEALKKSHRERESLSVPDLDYWEQPRTETTSRNWTLILLVIILAVNLIAVTVWLLKTYLIESDSTKGPSATEMTQSASSTSVTEPMINDLPLSPELEPVKPVSPKPPQNTNTQPVAKWSVQVTATGDKKAASDETKTPSSASSGAGAWEDQGYQVIQPGDYDDSAFRSEPTQTIAPKQTQVTPYSSLPYDVKNSLPEFIFVSHIYSDEPARRSVIINDARYRQGDQIQRGLTLDEIEEDAVVMTYEAYRFRVKVNM